MDYIKEICDKAKVSNLILNHEDESFSDIFGDEFDNNSNLINHEQINFPNAQMEFINKYADISDNNSYVCTANLINELSQKVEQMSIIKTEIVSYVNHSFNRKHFIVAQPYQKELASIVSSIILMANDMKAIRKISSDKIRVISNLSLLLSSLDKIPHLYDGVHAVCKQIKPLHESLVAMNSAPFTAVYEMSIVQVALSFAVEIWKFHNIDLFHQGAFQIRSYFKTTSSSPALIENPKIWDRSKSISFPECTNASFVSSPDPKLNLPAKAVSKSVLIIYKEESLRMYDIFEQTMHLQMDALSIEEQIYKSEIILVVELWFGEKRNEIIEEMRCVCERQLKVHLIASQGLHHHITVIFDYYYLAAVELVVHASLVSISPCYLRLPQTSANEADSNFEKNVSLYQSWHNILFTSTKNCGRRHAACLVHSHLCQLLLSVIDSLMSTFQDALSFFSSEQRSQIDDKLHSQLCPTQSKSINWMKFAPNELERLAFILQSQTCEDDIADQASIDITKLSSRIVVIFNEFLKTASFHQNYVESLSHRTHKLRIKRFSEAFFFQEFSVVHLLAVYDPKYANPMYLNNIGRGRPSQSTASKLDDSSNDETVSLSSSSSSSSSHSTFKYECGLNTRSSATLVRRSSTINPFVPFSINSHETLAAKVRDSAYYRRLPPLPIECPDTDGESHDQPIILEEIFIPDSKRSTITSSIRSSDSSSSSDADGLRSSKRDGSIYKKKSKCKFDNNSIPVMRKLNPTFNRKNLPVQEKKVNLVGYRSVDCSAFDDNVHASAAPQQSGDSYKLASKQGIGTLKIVNGLSCFSVANNLDVRFIKTMSCSMPDLSNIGSKVKLRKKRDDKKSYHRFSSIYELEETQSWICVNSNENVVQSNGNFISPPDNNDDLIHNESSEFDDKRVNSDEKLTIVEMLSNPRAQQRPSSAYVYTQSNNFNGTREHNEASFKLDQNSLSRSTMDLSSLDSLLPAESILNEQVTFYQLKAKLMTDLSPQFQGNVYSEMSNIPASKKPYFSHRDSDELSASSSLHYIICVHGLDGEHRDLRLVKAYLSLALPEQRFEFLMSEANEQNTFADIDEMKELLVDEILDKIEDLREKPDKISFIGHSLGCILIRAAIASPRLVKLVPKFYTFLSLGGPHLGTLYGSSVLVNVGLWVMQKVRKSICLQQLALKDNPTDLRRSYLYRLSGQSGLEHFKYILLASSSQDRYVPYHSTRIELCKAAVKDNSELGIVYMEMVTKILQRLLRSGKTTVIRYDAHYTLPRSANNYIGRAAHIALIDSELFLEKFISVSAAKYFR